MKRYSRARAEIQMPAIFRELSSSQIRHDETASDTGSTLQCHLSLVAEPKKRICEEKPGISFRDRASARTFPARIASALCRDFLQNASDVNSL